MSEGVAEAVGYPEQQNGFPEDKGFDKAFEQPLMPTVTMTRAESDFWASAVLSTEKGCQIPRRAEPRGGTRFPFVTPPNESSGSGQNWTASTGWFCHTQAMTTKTIPEYLEDERQKDRDAHLRTEEEAARIQLLNHGHHRTSKQPKLELLSSAKAAPKAKTAAAARKKPRTARKTATKTRKAA